MDFRKNLTSLYYTNRGYVSIIKWCYFFPKMYRKKVRVLLNKYYINAIFFAVHFRKKVTPLYYTNIPPITIIKWRQIFSKVHPKKVLLHKDHTEKLTYVVGSKVGDFNFHIKIFLWHHINTPHSPLAVSCTFQLNFRQDTVWQNETKV